MLIAEIDVNHLRKIKIANNSVKKLLKKNKSDINTLKKNLGVNYIPETDEIAEFVKLVVKKNLQSLNGQTIGFDMGINKFIF
jgi:Asp-tRNA(Asn)/Glu-tRNA(Gln) amidotransferase B subunit|tara:strand:- start:64 stop:309 length:246 start_codon:yes stop_codon:yes gene_type:complete